MYRLLVAITQSTISPVQFNQFAKPIATTKLLNAGSRRAFPLESGRGGPRPCRAGPPAGTRKQNS
ncbi:hypothetical protein FTUN_6687 [Frigoriglobus tundricola]|uniref:Uncharacterized protein n=1 Tax=Frigoriglobus tundricola TaxID=2774151 RepID=A0A6M5YYJ6_9BACT|nr:hypothetical protein FTUN_6687 [Frigoriglobus tundricola]